MARASHIVKRKRQSQHERRTLLLLVLLALLLCLVGVGCVAQLALSAVLGPYMLFNEALTAHRAARIAPSVLIAAAGAALAWALAAGIVLVFLVGGAARMVAA